MRQGQQNRRGRGRGRKPQNPLARNYESNGPDVKIRGTASHIAEKYMSLARDALASGDTVTAESYLQHAEHYNRIIMAAQTQAAPPAQPASQAQTGDQANGGNPRGRQGPDGGQEAAQDAVPEQAQEPAHETVQGSAPEPEADRATPRNERGRGRRGRNGAQPSHEGNGAEPAEAASADEGESAPDTVS